jgi:hypothetical protein
MENKYNIRLFNTYTKRELMKFDFPLLPEVGEMIEMDRNNLFIVQQRGFDPMITLGLVNATLYGITEDDESEMKRNTNY